MILQVLLFRSFFFFLEYRRPFSHGPRNLETETLSVAQLESGSRWEQKSWASKMEEMKSITLEIFFLKGFLEGYGWLFSHM